MAVLAALVVVAVFAIKHYAASSDTVAVLGVILTPIVAIGAAAFGISATVTSGTAAGAAAGNVAAAAGEKAAGVAQQQVVHTKQGIQQARADLQQLKDRMESVAGFLQQAGGSSPGSETMEFATVTGQDPHGNPEVSRAQLPIDEVNQLREGWARVEARLEDLSD